MNIGLVVLGLVLGSGCARHIGVSVAGSTSVQPFLEVLAEKFEKETGIKVNVEGGGSSVGVQSAYNGSSNIGSVSRKLKPGEKGLEEFVIAKDGIAVIANPSNRLKNLTLEELQAVFSGKITNWRTLGGKDAPITVVVREEGSGTRAAFLELAMGGKTFTPNAIVQGATGSVRQTVSSIPGAVGFISMVQVDRSVKVLSIDGFRPSEEMISSGKYPISRPFLLVTKGKPVRDTKKFIDFVLSVEGQKLLRESGILPAISGGK